MPEERAAAVADSGRIEGSGAGGEKYDESASALATATAVVVGAKGGRGATISPTLIAAPSPSWPEKEPNWCPQ
jgi:hypothetical protein